MDPMDRVAQLESELAAQNGHLAEVGREFSGLRERVVVTMKEWAAKGSFNCTLDEIGDELNNLWEIVKGMRVQLAAERDARTELVAAGCREYMEKHAAVQADLDLQSHELDTVRSELVREKAARATDQESQNAARVEVEQHAGYCGKATRETLGLFLQRPFVILKAFGPEAYQAAKDVFAASGGDVSTLPAPPPEKAGDV